MNEAMEMLKELVEKAGMTAEQAWPYVVRHVWADALAGFCTAMVTSVALVAVIVASALRMRTLSAESIPFEDGSKWALPTVSFLVSAIVLVPVLLVGVCTNLPDLIEPTGATIRVIVGR